MENDALGELFRRKLENHRMPVDDRDWDEIERRLEGDKNKGTTVWLWRFATLAAAASVAALLFFNLPKNQTIPEIAENTETEEKSATQSTQPNPENHAITAVQSFNDSVTQLFSHSVTQSPSYSVTQSLSDSVTQSLTQSPSHSVTPSLNDSIIQLLGQSVSQSVSQSRWLFTASFGVGGNTGGRSDDTNSNSWVDQSSYVGANSSGNKYAVEMSGNILSFEYVTTDNFRDISHSPPFSFGVTARKNFGDNAGIESGLVYTQLSSHFDMWNYKMHQSLHYIGIPVNLYRNLGSSTSNNWRFYLSGGFIFEKGVRAIYRQEATWVNQINTTTVRTSIDGLQWSLSGGFGARYRLEKGWGIYLEPRAGYSFKNKQPISVRTEWPVYLGINLGLNYEL